MIYFEPSLIAAPPHCRRHSLSIDAADFSPDFRHYAIFTDIPAIAAAGLTETGCRRR